MSIYGDAKPGPIVCPFCKSDKHTRRLAYVRWSNEDWEVVRVLGDDPAYCVNCIETFEVGSEVKP